MIDASTSLFVTTFVIIEGVPKVIIWLQALVIFPSFLWGFFFGPIFMYEQYLTRSYHLKSKKIPKPLVLKKLRNYLRGAPEYYAHNDKKIEAELEKQSARRGLLLISPTIVGFIILLI